MQIGYCCNVHPGRSLEEVRLSLCEHSMAVKRIVSPDGPMPIGLWLSASTAEQLSDPQQRLQFRRWLDDAGLIPFTLNGFPFGDFHQSIVKQDVYRPTWAEHSRLQYTLDLVNILHDLLSEGLSGTISTLPLGWPSNRTLIADQRFFQQCAENLRRLVHHLAELQANTGRHIEVCIEPEPGCVLNSADDIVRFFNDFLNTGDGDDDHLMRSHLSVCHDICHSSVMFEDQENAIARYRQAGVSIGKVQVSSAIGIDFDSLSPADQQEAISQLSKFAEPRYLHQTTWRQGNEVVFFEDLPEAIAALNNHQFLASSSRRHGSVRVHFHVPIFADSLGLISTTQADIQTCLRALQENRLPVDHFEVETYAWNVLPPQWQPACLSSGIAQELNWLKSRLQP